MKLPYDFERKMRRFTISNLMNYVVGGMALVFVLDLFAPGLRLYSLLSFNWAAIMHGQVWRLVTFIFLPPNTSLLWIIFSLYFYWMVGTTLENQWGTFKFNLFYWVGILANIVAGMLMGYATNTYLNLSLFLAFAALNPNFQLLVFFVLPIKIKYLALLDVALYVYAAITGGLPTLVMIVVSLANVILFLGGDLLNNIKRDSQYWKTRRNFRKTMK
ncbi:MAG: rhomboid family intramembrane serine protease [Clostridia bacterium]